MTEHIAGPARLAPLGLPDCHGKRIVGVVFRRCHGKPMTSEVFALKMRGESTRKG